MADMPLVSLYPSGKVESLEGCLPTGLSAQSKEGWKLGSLNRRTEVFLCNS